jgi:uncharacterized membrane protein HdeD (DUF308 family)
MVAVGIYVFFVPQDIINVVLCASFAIISLLGLFLIVRYVNKLNKNESDKNIWELFCGIFMLAVGIIILFAWIFYSGAIATAIMAQLCSITFACLAFIEGTDHILRTIRFKKQGKDISLILISDIIFILTGVFLLIFPFAIKINIEIMLGIYFICAGTSRFLGMLKD